MKHWALILLIPVLGCGGADFLEESHVLSSANRAERVYLGVTRSLLSESETEELVQFKARVVTDKTEKDATLYARCAASQYTLERGWEFVRHIRTNVSKKGGVWIADAVYSHTSTLPPGQRTIDATYIVPLCVEKGIPTV